jgi:hypothetical protein
MAPAEHLVIIAFALIVGVVWSVWLWVMLVMPRLWSAYVEWENALWVRTGLLPEKWATKLKAIEKGATLKVIVVLGIAGSLAILFKT